MILNKDCGLCPVLLRLIWLYSSGKEDCYHDSESLAECADRSGDIFPLHPLDVVSSDSSTTDSSCIGTFIPQPISVGAGEL